MQHNVVEDLEHLLVPIAELTPAPRNAQLHSAEQLADIKASLLTYGQDQPLVVQREGMIVRVGNGRLQAARELGWTHVAALQVDADEATMIGRQLVDNRTAEKGETDEQALADLLEEVWAAHLPTGYSDEEIASLLEHVPDADGRARSGTGTPDADGNEDPDGEGDAASPAGAEGRAQLGDLWLLGDHRLIVGDATDDASVKRLAGDQLVDQLLTDPPYGVAYESAGRRMRRLREGHKREGDYDPIHNDAAADVESFRLFFARFLELAPLAKTNTAYVFMAGQELHTLRGAMDDAGYKWGDYLVWAKQHAVMGRKDYNAAHEFIVYGWRGRHRFHGRPGATTLLTFDRPFVSRLHPTQKPVELLCRLLKDGSRPGATAYDPFAGSGSTIIAGEMTGRRVLAIELDPGYATAAIARWERFTGRTAEREEV